MKPKFQKQSALKFEGRIIPEAKPSGINGGGYDVTDFFIK